MNNIKSDVSINRPSKIINATDLVNMETLNVVTLYSLVSKVVVVEHVWS